ncbi:MAG: replicative DNA helicase [Candidatus Hydrogenedentales bacterium]|jgi:replicative DNA helicase
MVARSERPAGTVSAGLTHYDRMPPQDVDAERAVLGAILVRPQSVGEALEVLRGNLHDLFYIPAHQVIFDGIVAIFSANKAIDRVTLMDEIGSNKALESVGNESYLSELIGAVPISANIEYYSEIVLEKALRRKLIDLCAFISRETYEDDGEVADLLDSAEKEIFALNEQRQTNRVFPISELLEDGVKRIEQQIKSGSGITGLATYYTELDRKLSGLQRSDMIILAARPSVGKTAFALNIAANVALEGKSVLLFSLEMAKEQLVQRLLCMVGGVDSNRLRNGFLADREFPNVQKAAAKLTKAKIFIDESAGLTPLELRSKARRQASQAPLDLIIIDYMQLMHASGRIENRQNEISLISRSIKALARELSVPIVTLSQLSREAEKDDRGMPKLAHLRESGAIEQDADVVLILSRPPAIEREERENVILVNIAKQRNGPVGHFELIFERNTQRFKDLAPASLERQVPPQVAYQAERQAERYAPVMPEPYSEEEEDLSEADYIDPDDETIPF